MAQVLPHWIAGMEEGKRLTSRALEERIQQTVAMGGRYVKVEAFGQHGIGGRLWVAGDDPVRIKIIGTPGQRTGSMGFPNTTIEITGNGSEDIGWLNAGAEIIVHGHATNGTGNAMAQGKILVAGNIGARGMTMTKANPRFEPPELWVLGSVGDYFAEFMAGGIAVICGLEPQNEENVLGYRPCVGMVNGKILVRGKIGDYSRADAKAEPITDSDWAWLTENLNDFLFKIDRSDDLETLSNRDEWQVITALPPWEKAATQKRNMARFRAEVWDSELGRGGLIGDLTTLDRSTIPTIAQGELRRFVPTWENQLHLAPCQDSCPSGIPVVQRWSLIRDGRVDAAVEMALEYSPFPSSVCGHLCPNLCMAGCTRGISGLPPVDVTQLGQASIEARTPDLPKLTGPKVAIVGGGPAGLSAAWQLRMAGIEPVVFDRSEGLGGKMAQMIPASRLPQEALQAELGRIEAVLDRTELGREMNRETVSGLKDEFDLTILALGASRPRLLAMPGSERLIPANDFLIQAKAEEAKVGAKVVIIGAGNVGCDAATEAYRLGAEEVTLIDIQKPLSFGHERDAAEAAGATFKWPVFTQEITPDGVLLTDGELLPAETVIISIGDTPDQELIPSSIKTDQGFITVDDDFRTSDPHFFAIGDAVKPGLLTDAIGAGRQAAQAIIATLNGVEIVHDERQAINPARVELAYFDPRAKSTDDLDACAGSCASCGSCRDCGICEAICPQAAISRVEGGLHGFEMVVDPELCIGCGFCESACPCGIWAIHPAGPLADEG